MNADFLIAADRFEDLGSNVKDYLRREPSFLTGSFAYGTPRYNSDIDLVIWISEADLKWLKQEGGQWKTMRHTTSFKLGRLNLLCITDFDTWQKWREGTDRLIKQRPVTKAQAIAVFAQLFGETLNDEDKTPDPSYVEDDS